jgi:hypothetical protein
MIKNFLDVLARAGKGAALERLDPLAQKLEVLSRQLAAILSVLDASSRRDLLAQFDAEVLASLKETEARGAGSTPIPQSNSPEDRTASAGNGNGPTTGTPTPSPQQQEFLAENITPEMREWARQSKEQLTPEILEWARQQINVEEILASIREVRETGGLELRDFVQELEQLASDRE